MAKQRYFQKQKAIKTNPLSSRNWDYLLALNAANASGQLWTPAAESAFLMPGPVCYLEAIEKTAFPM